MRVKISRSVALVVSALIATACGSDSFSSAAGGQGGNSNTGGQSTGGQNAGGQNTGGSAVGGQVNGIGGNSAWHERCQGVTDHNAVCGKGSADAASVDSCVTTQPCTPSVWSAAVMDTVMSCLSTLACTSPDDDCISATVPDQTPIKQALFTACEDKMTACPDFQGCLETLFLVSDSLAATLQDCLSQPCDAAATCILNGYTSAMTAAGCTGELPFGG
jgi:hypothetical protein